MSRKRKKKQEIGNGKNKTINAFHMAKAIGNLALRTVCRMLAFFQLELCISVGCFFFN